MKVEQKKKEHIKKMAADRRMAQKFFLIQVELGSHSKHLDISIFSGNGHVSNSSSWYCYSQKQTTGKISKYPVLVECIYTYLLHERD